MKIALVDDQPEELRATEAFLRKYLVENFPEVVGTLRVDTFADAVKFLSEFEKGAYDLLIFDIIMKPLNGIQVAQIVRGKDRDAQIIFLTNSEEFMLAGYEVFAVGYFLKPLAENVEVLAKTFSYVFPRLAENQKKLPVAVKGGELLIPYRDIRYVDIDEHHHPCVHLSDKKFSANMTYEEIFDALKEDARFLECYHRIIVNMDFIKRMVGEDFILTDGEKIPISRRKNKAAKLKYMEHLLAVNSTNTW